MGLALFFFFGHILIFNRWEKEGLNLIYIFRTSNRHEAVYSGSK